jgi:ribosome modulation factor
LCKTPPHEPIIRSMRHEFSPITTTAWRRGFGARGNGRAANDNPLASTQDREQWLEGWMERDRQIRQAQSEKEAAKS